MYEKRYLKIIRLIYNTKNQNHSFINKNHHFTLFPLPPFPPPLAGRSPLALWLLVNEAPLVETVAVAALLGHSVSTLDEPSNRLHLLVLTVTVGRVATAVLAAGLTEEDTSSFSATELNFVDDITYKLLLQ